MAAAPDAIWSLVSDVTRIGEFSPETFEGEWLDGATGPAVGAKFRGHVKRNGRGPVYWTTCVVTDCVPGKSFGFGVGPSSTPINTWRYDIVPAGDGADVTESFQLAETLPIKLYWRLLGGRRGKTNEHGMRTTLERIKAVVER